MEIATGRAIGSQLHVTGLNTEVARTLLVSGSMPVIYPRTVSTVSKLGAAVRVAARHPRRFARGVARLPLEQQAAALISSLPVIELAEATGDVTDVIGRIAPKRERHGWSLGVAEQLILDVLIRSRGCSTAFEIGTFNGGTTRVLAEALPEGGRVWTIDLPPAEFDSTQSPDGFSGSQVGVAYRDSPARGKITQLFGDSLEFDFSEFEHSADLVLVDGGHEYEHGFADTATALRLVRPGGLVLWDDFEPYWHGLVDGICDAMNGRDFGRLAGTSLAVYVNN